MELENMAANADAVIDAAPEVVAEPIATEPVTAAPDATPIAKSDDVTATQAFAKRLADKTAETEKALSEKFNATIAKLGMEWNGKPITTQAELDGALTEKALAEEAAKNNVPVELYSRLTQAEAEAMTTKQRLAVFEREKQIAVEAESLASDAKWGTFYKANEKAIRETADQLNVDLGTAKLIVLDNLGVPQINEEEIGNKYIQEYLDKKRTIKPVEGSGSTPVTVPKTPTTWEEARLGAKAAFAAQKG